MVADVIVETPDTSTLVLFTVNDRLDYTAGHFLTIDPHQFKALDRFTEFLEHLKGKPEPPRAYSMCSAPHERYLAVTVKEERFIPKVTKYPPLLSPLLVKHTMRGMRLIVTGFTGPYTLPGDVASLRRHCDALVPRPLIAAAGGINASNAADYARAGADVLVTSAPYTAKPLDVKVTMEPR